MLLSPCLTSYAAEDQTATVTSGEVGNITITDGTSAVNTDSTVTVQGDVTTSGSNNSHTDTTGSEHPTADPAIVANNATVTVDGNVTAGAGGVEQTAISASNDSTVTVTGNVSGTEIGIVSNSSDVTVNGNVTGAWIGVEAIETGSTIIIDGNVTSYGKQGDYTDEQGNVIGTSTFDTGVVSFGENDIIITGDVYSDQKGVEIHTVNSGTNDGQIIIEGTITGDVGIAITDNANSTNGIAPFSSAEEVLAATPEITVYEIDSDTPVAVYLYGVDDATYIEAYDQIFAAINYIIKTDANSGVTVSGDNIKDVNGYDTVNIGEAFTVAATVPEGYTVSGGNNVSVIDNHDGTFTLTLTNLNGGIFVSVKLIPVTNNDGSVSYVAQSSYTDPNQAPAGSIVVTSNTSSAEASALVASISGDKPAQTISFNIASITPQQYKAAIISTVATVPANGAFNIITDTIATLDAGMIEAFKARPDIDINIVFPYNGKMLKVTIPAGYDLDSLLDEFGYCGFLRLMTLLEATEL
ncbi:hypothetical protein [Butyrivibrio fibrisolvens]|uniref:hypothetical protein n=1 Tax=Butyrivibrio fibrisolvens TaxID=831 RepID=UPI0004010B36|nr:hypothetical protein [Butyrivibrio fibrisolvens]